MTAGGEDEVTSEEMGAGALGSSSFVSEMVTLALRNLVFPGSVMETVGDGLRLFSFGNIVARQLFYTL